MGFLGHCEEIPFTLVRRLCVDTGERKELLKGPVKIGNVTEVIKNKPDHLKGQWT